MGFLLAASVARHAVNLSSKNLTAVPDDVPPTVEDLDLSCNRIGELRRGDFGKTPSLRLLNVSWNSVGQIHAEAFLRTPLLESLDLSHNRLRNLSGQRYLRHTLHLSALNLSHNDFLSARLGGEFAALAKLTWLALGARNVSVGDFSSIAQVALGTLCVSVDEEAAYEAGSLRDVQARRLRVGLGAPAVPLQMIEDALRHFEEVELMNLTEGYGELSQLLAQRPPVFTSHLYLRYISIRWSELTHFINVCLRVSLPHLTTSDVVVSHLPYSDSPVVQTSNTVSFTAKRVQVASIFFSQEAVYDFFINMPVARFAFTHISMIHMTCPKSESRVQEVDFSHCALSDSIFSRVEGEQTLECTTLVHVWRLNLAGNNLKRFAVLSKRLQHMRSLRDLDLSLNLLAYDASEDCLWPVSVTRMIVNDNSLTGAAFRCLPKEVETLELQNNEISAVPPSVLTFEKLSSLNLGGNRLRDLPVCRRFPGLRRLLLNSNSLHAPSVPNMETCPRLRTLDASANPFICGCDLRSFLSLGAAVDRDGNGTGLDLVGWPWAYQCAYPEALRNATLSAVTVPEVSCSTLVLAAAILCPAAALTLAAALLCRHFDVLWYLKMIWAWTRAKHRARVRARQEDRPGVEFHAFLSYSQHDAEWVRNSLLPNLEGPAAGGRLRICHHEKDFVPGRTIVQNIIGCVERSRRSVFVLSGHFVKSEWCHYELYFASHQHLSQGSDSVVLLLLEPLPQYLIPSRYYQLKAMMGRHTYLEWPRDRAKHRLFWANLRAALQANLPTAAGQQE